MKPNLKTIAIAVLVVAAVFLVSRDCGLSGKLRQAKLEYAGYKAIAEADHELSRAHIEQLTNDIALKDEAIVKLSGEVAVKKEAIRNLSTRLDELQNAEPSYPEMESHPLVINLRGQIKTLTEMFTLAQGTIDNQAEQLRLWEGKYNAQVEVAREFEAMYLREAGLRKSCENLNKEFERNLKWSRLKFKGATTVAVIAGGVLVYSLVK